MKPAVGYLRVSTKDQMSSGLGIEAQRIAIKSFADQNGFEIVQEHVEVASGKGADALEQRPELASAISHAKKVKAPIIVAKLCRLSRDVAFISSMMSQRVAFIVTSLGTSADPFLLHIYAAMAEQERRMISERTRSALQAKKLHGAQLGNKTNLEQAQKKGSRSNAEAADRFAENILPVVTSLQGAGVSSHTAIAEALNLRGIKTARGGKWHGTTVTRLLCRQQTKSLNAGTRKILHI